MDEIIKFAKENGYETVKRLDIQFKGYEVYEPSFDDEMPVVGLPLFILAKGTELRLTSPEECFKILDLLN